MSKRWLQDLMATIGECWECHSPSLNISFQYRRPEDRDDCWEFWAYPAVQEMVGGEHDGETIWSGFNFDLLQLIENIEAVTISVSTGMGSQPPEVSCEGRFRGKPIWLHLYLEPPDDAEATEVLDVTEPGQTKVRKKK